MVYKAKNIEGADGTKPPEEQLKHTDLRELWKELSFERHVQIKQVMFSYSYLGKHFRRIHIEEEQMETLVENVFYQFMIARFGRLFPIEDQELITTSDLKIKEEYNKLFIGTLKRGDKNVDTVITVIAILVTNLVKKVFQTVEYNSRLTIEVVHCILFCTLGVVVGDNCVKCLIGKALGHEQVSRFFVREMFFQKILKAKIREIEEQKVWPELKKMFYKPPPSPEPKVAFDEGQQKDRSESGFVRSLDKYKLISTQMSSSFVSGRMVHNLKPNSLKKDVYSMNVSLECNSPFLKQIKKPRAMHPRKTVKVEKHESMQYNRNLGYWQEYLDNYKNNPGRFTVKETFPPLDARDPSVHHSAVVTPLPPREETPKSLHAVYSKEIPKLDMRPRHPNRFSFVAKREPAENQAPIRTLKAGGHASSKVVRLKVENKEFCKKLLKTSDVYEEALTSQFHKLSLIR